MVGCDLPTGTVAPFLNLTRGESPASTHSLSPVVPQPVCIAIKMCSIQAYRGTNGTADLLVLVLTDILALPVVLKGRVLNEVCRRQALL